MRLYSNAAKLDRDFPGVKKKKKRRKYKEKPWGAANTGTALRGGCTLPPSPQARAGHRRPPPRAARGRSCGRGGLCQPGSPVPSQLPLRFLAFPGQRRLAEPRVPPPDNPGKLWRLHPGQERQARASARPPGPSRSPPRRPGVCGCARIAAPAPA